jgi:serine/threonine protein kinase
LGPHEILAPLGAGGMGEVYRARDTRLGREVAIKVLPPEMTSDEDRRQRFAREARAASALSHPNVAIIYLVAAGLVVAAMLLFARQGRRAQSR